MSASSAPYSYDTNCQKQHDNLMYYVRIVACNVKACRHVEQVAAFAIMFIILSKLWLIASLSYVNMPYELGK